MVQERRGQWSGTFAQLLWIVALVVPSLCISNDGTNEKLTEQLQVVYERWRQACSEGDIATYLDVRDPEDVARIEKIIGRPLTAEDISECGQRPITELRFLDISREGSWAALRYHGGDSEPDAAGARVQFQVLLFHLHENGWKLVKSGSITHPKFTKSGELVTIDMIHMSDRLRLPSQRDNAK